MAKVNGHGIYEFDEFRLNLGTLMLCRGKEEVSLPPKAVKTLAVLIENHGEIISKSDLIETVWENSIVEESNLSQYLYLLRKTLGNDPEGRPYIETLRRRGYRFTGKIKHLNGGPSSAGTAAVDEPARHHEVARRGNVFEVSDWTDPEKALAGSEQAVNGRKGQSNLSLALAAVAVLLAVGSAAFWMRSSADSTDKVNTELNFQRLTNGIVVEDATISPDGKYFTYHTLDNDSYRMWLQQTGQSTRVEVMPASTKGLLGKTFSPDGQFIYFVASDPDGAHTLYRVPTLGGPVAGISNDVDSPPSFSPDGREMVFGRWNKEKKELEYVIKPSEGTGIERVLHTVKIEIPWYGTAAWSPDGKTIAVEVPEFKDETVGRCRLAVANVDKGAVAPLSNELWDNCYRMMWAPDGRGVYLVGTKKGDAMSSRRDQLYHVSYPDGRSQRITTDESRNQVGSLGVTRDGAVLTVPYNRSSQIWAMDPKGHSGSAVQLTSGLNDGRAGIAPLADGRVAYVARTGDNLNIWTMNQDGSDQKQITVEPPFIEEVRSGGDGRYLVFSALIVGSQHLFRINPDGTDMRQLTFGQGKQVDSSISHDGAWVAFGWERSDRTLWKMPIEGGEPVLLDRKNCFMPHFSPDDKLISCVEEQKIVHIVSATDGSLVRSFEALPLSTLSFGARWTPDGRALVYIVTQNGISNLWSQPVDGGPPKPLTDFTSGSIYHFAYSLDGTRLFLAKGQQLRDAVLITPSGGKQRAHTPRRHDLVGSAVICLTLAACKLCL